MNDEERKALDTAKAIVETSQDRSARSGHDTLGNLVAPTTLMLAQALVGLQAKLVKRTEQLLDANTATRVIETAWSNLNDTHVKVREELSEAIRDRDFARRTYQADVTSAKAHADVQHTRILALEVQVDRARKERDDREAALEEMERQRDEARRERKEREVVILAGAGALYPTDDQLAEIGRSAAISWGGMHAYAANARNVEWRPHPWVIRAMAVACECFCVQLRKERDRSDSALAASENSRRTAEAQRDEAQTARVRAEMTNPVSLRAERDAAVVERGSLESELRLLRDSVAHHARALIEVTK